MDALLSTSLILKQKKRDKVAAALVSSLFEHDAFAKRASERALVRSYRETTLEFKFYSPEVPRLPSAHEHKTHYPVTLGNHCQPLSDCSRP